MRLQVALQWLSRPREPHEHDELYQWRMEVFQCFQDFIAKRTQTQCVFRCPSETSLLWSLSIKSLFDSFQDSNPSTCLQTAYNHWQDLHQDNEKEWKLGVTILLNLALVENELSYLQLAIDLNNTFSFSSLVEAPLVAAFVAFQTEHFASCLPLAREFLWTNMNESLHDHGCKLLADGLVKSHGDWGYAQLWLEIAELYRVAGSREDCRRFLDLAMQSEDCQEGGMWFDEAVLQEKMFDIHDAATHDQETRSFESALWTKQFYDCSRFLVSRTNYAASLLTIGRCFHHLTHISSNTAVARRLDMLGIAGNIYTYLRNRIFKVIRKNIIWCCKDIIRHCLETIVSHLLTSRDQLSPIILKANNYVFTSSQVTECHNWVTNANMFSRIAALGTTMMQEPGQENMTVTQLSRRIFAAVSSSLLPLINQFVCERLAETKTDILASNHLLVWIRRNTDDNLELTDALYTGRLMKTIQAYDLSKACFGLSLSFDCKVGDPHQDTLLMCCRELQDLQQHSVWHSDDETTRRTQPRFLTLLSKCDVGVVQNLKHKLQQTQ